MPEQEGDVFRITPNEDTRTSAVEALLYRQDLTNEQVREAILALLLDEC